MAIFETSVAVLSLLRMFGAEGGDEDSNVGIHGCWYFVLGLLIVGVLTLILLSVWPQHSFRPFEASQVRARTILAQTGGKIGSFADYKKTVGGGDAVEYGVARTLAKGGNLNEISLAQQLQNYEMFYVRNSNL